MMITLAPTMVVVTLVQLNKVGTAQTLLEKPAPALKFVEMVM